MDLSQNEGFFHGLFPPQPETGLTVAERYRVLFKEQRHTVAFISGS